jgi:hypothetical protein
VPGPDSNPGNNRDDRAHPSEHPRGPDPIQNGQRRPQHLSPAVITSHPGIVAQATRISLPAAETHGNEIEADALEDYVDALIAERLATEPQLLTHAAEALRRSSAALPDEDAGEFRELGGSDRLAELTGDTWDDMEAEDKRLVAITLLESVLVDPEGDTVADRLSVDWRF